VGRGAGEQFARIPRLRVDQIDPSRSDRTAEPAETRCDEPTRVPDGHDVFCIRQTAKVGHLTVGRALGGGSPCAGGVLGSGPTRGGIRGSARVRLGAGGWFCAGFTFGSSARGERGERCGAKAEGGSGMDHLGVSSFRRVVRPRAMLSPTHRSTYALSTRAWAGVPASFWLAHRMFPRAYRSLARHNRSYAKATERETPMKLLKHSLLIGLSTCALIALQPASAQTAGTDARVSRPGDTFKECRNCPEMVVLPAGTFTMGSPADEPSRRDNEAQREISFPRAFAMSATPVTWDQWEACVRDNVCDGIAVETALATSLRGEPDPDWDWGRGTRPVVGVSWYDAQIFVGWLNAKTGEDDAYRLPSEAEWEYGARAGTTTAFPWGQELDHDYGNFGTDEQGRLGGKAEGRDVWLDETSPVGSFPPNAFGLYDMHGNIFEWVEDCYEADRAHAPADGSANKEGN